MASPVLHVSDTTADASYPITTTYTNDTTTISFSTTYPLLKRLLAHPPCLHNTDDEWPCPSCESSFTTPFWTTAATLLDYFADFFPADTPTMKSLWFHLVDVWQSASLHLDTHTNTRLTSHHLQRATQFHTDYHQTLTLLHTVIFGARRRSPISPPNLLHSATTRVEHTTGQHYDTGPWISGLPPWAQWLSEGSPGAAGCGRGLRLRSRTRTPPPPPSPCSSTSPPCPTPAPRTRHIPLPAIAIVQKHARRATRRATALYAAADNDDAAAASLAAFTARSLVFPAAGAQATYTALDGRAVRYALYNGAPPVMRPAGLLDEQMEGAEPGLGLLDECVGICKGEGGYVAVSGAAGEEDEEEQGEEQDEDEQDEDEEQDEDGEEGWFDMWAVREEGEMGGERSELTEGFWDMFDGWALMEE